jgi:hypothetical protein
MTLLVEAIVMMMIFLKMMMTLLVEEIVMMMIVNEY